MPDDMIFPEVKYRWSGNGSLAVANQPVPPCEFPHMVASPLPGRRRTSFDAERID